jgi:adenine deaminase
MKEEIESKAGMEDGMDSRSRMKEKYYHKIISRHHQIQRKSKCFIKNFKVSRGEIHEQ